MKEERSIPHDDCRVLGVGEESDRTRFGDRVDTTQLDVDPDSGSVRVYFQKQ